QAIMLPPPLRRQQFLYFLPLPQGQGSLRPTRLPRLRIGSGLASASAPALVCCWLRWNSSVAPGASACVALVSTHVDPTNSSLSCSILKIRLVAWSPTVLLICSKCFIPSRLDSTFG